MTDQQQQTKIINAIALVKTEHARLGELLLDLEKLLTLEPTTGQLVKTLFDFWHARWGAVYNEPYQFTPPGRDAKNFKALLRTLPLEEVRARMCRYLEDQDPFLAMQRHPLGTFFAQINRFGAATPTMAEPRPVGCRHTPSCSSETEHTRKMMAERRRS